jgi:3-oxoacyl-[acyl-carrier protein] reductase
MDLKNGKAIITGGSLGIGKATARALVTEGARVLITGRNEERLVAAARDTGADYLVADVSNPDDAAHTVKTAVKVLGGLNILINNAGIASKRQPVTGLTLADFQRVYAVNVFGAAIMGREAARVFQEQEYGNIINVASTAALKGYENGTVYASSKFALRGMTMCWQAELRKFNIRVQLINPSEVTTAFGNAERVERDTQPNRLRSEEIAHAIVSALKMDDRGFIPELTVFATNPW